MAKIGDGSPFTIKDLRHAVQMAEQTHCEVDVECCGGTGSQAMEQNGTYATQSRLVVAALTGVPDTLPVPKVSLTWVDEDGPRTKLEMEGYGVLCPDYDKLLKSEKDAFAQTKVDAGITEVPLKLPKSVAEHGTASGAFSGPGPSSGEPGTALSLQMLAVRALHRAGDPVASGLAEPGDILQRAMGLRGETEGRAVEDESGLA